MSANRPRVLKRVTELLNICDAATYSATLSPRNKTRNADAIADFVDEAGLMILKAIAERPNEFRAPFLGEYAVVNGALLPAHIGPPARVRITLFANGPVREGKPLNYRKIDSYRENPQHVYDEVDHDQSSETQGGGYVQTFSNVTLTPFAQVPVGAVDGSNAVYTIDHEPVDPAAVVVIIDGVVQRNGIDFTMSGATHQTITLGFAPAIGSEMFAYYYYNLTSDEVVLSATGGDHRPSSLAGFYDIWDDRFFFTGASAAVMLARLPVRADNLTLIPEIMENTWIRLSIGEAGKVGTGGYESTLIGEYARRGMTDLEDFKNGGRIFKEIDEPTPQSAIHTVTVR